MGRAALLGVALLFALVQVAAPVGHLIGHAEAAGPRADAAAAREASVTRTLTCRCKARRAQAPAVALDTAPAPRAAQSPPLRRCGPRAPVAVGRCAPAPAIPTRQAPPLDAPPLRDDGCSCELFALVPGTAPDHEDVRGKRLAPLPVAALPPPAAAAGDFASTGPAGRAPPDPGPRIHLLHCRFNC